MSDPAPAAPAVPPDATPLEVFFKGNRRLAAAALLVLLEAVPVVGLVLALREDNGVWIVLASVLTAGALLPPLGVFLGQRWGYLLGQYVVWASLVAVILRVLHTGFTPVFLVPAVLLGTLLVALSGPRSADGESRRAKKEPESFGVWAKENLEAIVIAFIMALVIRCFCIEVFKIPSSSMEPTLLGDVSGTHSREGCAFGDYHVPLNSPAPGGDRIMVTKYYYAFSAVERFDVVVFKFPLNQAKNFIKRVVGLPNEDLLIYKGNLFVKKPGEAKFQIARRTLRTQDSIWIDPGKRTNGYLGSTEIFKQTWEAGALPDGKSHAAAVVAENELATQETGGERSIRIAHNPGYLDDSSGEVDRQVDDVRIAFDFEITSAKGVVFAEVVNAYGRFEARLDTEGDSQLRYHAPGSEKSQPTSIVPLKDVHLAMDRRYRLDLSIYDGLAIVRVNGGERAKFPFIDTREDIRENPAPSRQIAFGSRGVTFKARNLDLGRDIYYRGRHRELGLREDEVVHIPPGFYMMMGDNVANSHDSRAWVRREYVMKDGRTVVCEAQQVSDSYRSTLGQTLMDRLGLPKLPDIAIDGDEHGNEVAMYRADSAPPGIAPQYVIEHEEKAREFRFVDEKFVVGKALWIWWPQGRWFHLIR